MRFHHSTRRGRNRLAGGHAHAGTSGAAAAAGKHAGGGARGPSARVARWSHLSYCRQSNIHFNRRLPVEPPPAYAAECGAGRRPPSDELAAAAAAAAATTTTSTFGARMSPSGESAQVFEASCGCKCAGAVATRADSARCDSPGAVVNEAPPPTQSATGAGAATEPDTDTGELCARLGGLCVQCNSGGRSLAAECSIDVCEICCASAGASQVDSSEQMVATRFGALAPDATCERCNPKSWPQQPEEPIHSASPQPTEPPHKSQAYVGARKPETSPPQTRAPATAAASAATASKAEAAAAATATAAADTSKPQVCQMDLASARERLLAQVEKHPFWSNKAARRMRLCAPEERCVYLYELVSYCERRELEWRFEPHTGRLTAGSTPFRRPPSAAAAAGPSLVAALATSSASSPSSPPRTPPLAQSQQPDAASPSAAAFDYGPSLNRSLGQLPSCETAAAAATATTTTKGSLGQTGKGARLVQRATQSSLGSAGSDQLLGAAAAVPSAELVWAIEVPPKSRPNDFVGSIYTCEVPQTSFVKRCHGCNGRGRLKCNSCYGVGYEVCLSCSGRGTNRSWISNNRSSTSRYPDNSSSSAATGISGGGGGRRSSSRAPTSLDPSDADDEPPSWRRSRDDPASGGISGGDSSHASPLHSEACLFCDGSGHKRCWTCAGRANLTCTGCAGAGQVRCYLRLSITWRNHRDELLINNNDSILPRDRLRLASGLLLIDEIGSPQVARMDEDRLAATLLSTSVSTAAGSSSPSPNIGGATSPTEAGATNTKNTSAANHKKAHVNRKTTDDDDENNPIPNSHRNSRDLFQQVDAIQKSSARLIERHKGQLRGEKLIKQRQKLTQIECFIVKYDWKRRQGHFVIYGDERKVYIAKYPFKSICNIA